MTDITLNTVSSGYNLGKINDNFDTVEDVINDDVLHLEGGNNVLRQDIDANGNRLINLPAPLGSGEPLRKGDITTDETGATIQYVDDAIAGTIVPMTLTAAVALDTALIGQIVQITDRADGQFEYVLASGVTPNTFDVIQCTSPIATLALVLRVGNTIEITKLGAIAGVDIAAHVRAAQDRLVIEGGGKIVIDINGSATMASGTTVDPSYADYVIDVQSGIEITAIPSFTMLGDKSVGGDVAGYCLFHIFEDKKDIKIHGFAEIDGGDKSTVKGIGQFVAIRGNTGVTKATNILIWDVHCKQMRNEPFRLGQTLFAGHIGDNVHIWNVSVDGCESHGVTMRSMINSSASNLTITDAGRLGIDMSSYCTNVHLHGGAGPNTFINTTGGFKIDGSSGKDEFVLSNFNCSASDVYYDGGDGAGGPGNGTTSANGFAFRAICRNAVISNIVAINCGGSGISVNTAGSGDDDLNMLFENINIDNITVGDGIDPTFTGKAFQIRHDSAGDLGLTLRNVKISNTITGGILNASNIKGDLELVNANVSTTNANSSGPTNNIHLHLSLVDSVYNVVKDGTNGGSDDINIFIHEFEGDSELDIENSTSVTVTGDAPIRSTRTRQIRFDDCPDFQISNLTGNGTSMVWVAGTMTVGMISGLTGSYSDGLIFENAGTAYTANKGLYADCINSGAGGYVINSTAVQDNLL